MVSDAEDNDGESSGHSDDEDRHITMTVFLVTSDPERCEDMSVMQ